MKNNEEFAPVIRGVIVHEMLSKGVDVIAAGMMLKWLQKVQLDEEDCSDIFSALPSNEYHYEILYKENQEAKLFKKYSNSSEYIGSITFGRLNLTPTREKDTIEINLTDIIKNINFTKKEEENMNEKTITILDASHMLNEMSREPYVE